MDLSCIISSGDLELYVLGSLSPEEAYQVEQLMSIFPEVREEVDRISETVPLRLRVALDGESHRGDRVFNVTALLVDVCEQRVNRRRIVSACD